MRSRENCTSLCAPANWTWIDAYQKYVGKTPPARIARETAAVPAASNVNDVWVNTRSGKYWKPGSRYYGKTKQGEFMPELDALDRGYSPAGGTGQCYAEKPETDKSYRRPDSAGRNGRTGRCPGSGTGGGWGTAVSGPLRREVDD
jgi:hypothetical protein